MTSPPRGYFNGAVRAPKPISKVENHLYKVDWSPAMLPELPDGKVTIDMSVKPLQQALDAASISFQAQNMLAYEAFEALSSTAQAESELLKQVRVATTKRKESGANGEDKTKK